MYPVLKAFTTLLFGSIFRSLNGAGHFSRFLFPGRVAIGYGARIGYVVSFEAWYKLIWLLRSTRFKSIVGQGRAAAGDVLFIDARGANGPIHCAIQGRASEESTCVLSESIAIAWL